MRIALISRAVFGPHGFGGMERHVLELARFLARAQVEVTLFTMPARRPVAWNEPGVELEIVQAPRLPLDGIPDRVINYPYWSYTVGKRVASKNFDVVHAHGMAGWGYSLQLANGTARAPLVMNPHGMEEFKTTPGKRLAYAPFHYFSRQAAKQASALIGTDSCTAEEIPHYLNVPRKKVVLIPNGIDMEAAVSCVNPEIMQALAAHWMLLRRAPILLSVGRLEANKGFEVLIDALARIRASLPSTWVWLLVGDGSERANLESMLRMLRLGDHARLLGELEDVALHNLYELATLFVHPTLYEGSSIVTVEAMAHRRPIVATAVGGIPDKVQQGRNGYLVTPGNPIELGDKILLALRDSKRLKEMGDASLTLACQTFDWQQTIRQTLALYDRVLGKVPPPPPLTKLNLPPSEKLD